MHQQDNQQSKQWLGWMMWSMGAAFFFLHYFIRVAPSVIIPELMRDFQVTASQMGAIAFYFYLAYVGAQIPLGILVDRWGVRYLLATCVLLSGVCTYLLTLSTHIEMVYLLRFGFGLGAAIAFVSAAKLAKTWLPASHFALALGLTQALGMFGGWIGTAPMAFIMESYGWRATFASFSWLFLALALLVVFFVRNSPNQAQGIKDANESASFSDLKAVLLCPRTWINASFCGLLFLPMAIYGEFWSVHVMEQTQGITHTQAGFAASAIFIGWCIGGPLSGWIADRVGRLPVMRWGSIGCLIVLPILIYVPLPFFLILAFNLAFGLCNSTLVASYTVAGEMHSTKTSGLALAIANMMTIAFGMFISPLFGRLLDISWATHATMIDSVPVYLAGDFQHTMMMLPAAVVLALICTFFIKETLQK